MHPAFFSRRELLARSGTGLGMLGLAALLADEVRGTPPVADARGSPAVNPLAPNPPHLKPKARRLVPLFMNGGPSHVDPFAPKPNLAEYHGKPLTAPNLRTERKTAGALRSPFALKCGG